MSLKLLICLAIFSLLIVTIVWVIQVLMSDTMYANVKRREVETVSENIKDIVSSDDEDMTKKIELNAEKYDVCIKLYSVDGGEFEEKCSVIVFVESILANIKDENVTYFYNQAKMNKGIYSTRMTFDSNLGMPQDTDRELSIVSIYAEIVNAGDQGEYLMLINSVVTPIETARKTVIAQFSYIIFFLIIGTIATAFLLSKLISKPLSGMNESAKQLAMGNYDVDFNVGGYREINELSMTLNYAAKELSKNDHLQKELIANISHDLRTPLTMIKSYAEMIRDISGDDPVKREQHLQVIIDETDRLNNLVGDLLSVSKIQSGRSTLEKTKFSLSESVKSIVETFRVKETDGGYTINLDCPADFTVFADEDKIKQVVSNLISNAVKFCGERKTVDVVLKKQGRQVKVSVIDYGCGIAAEDLDHIWDRYYRGSSNMVRSVEGSGLGLSICKEILSLHKSDFGVDSTLGKGSTFWFMLDLVK